MNISEKLFEINGTREENVQSPPPCVRFVAKFPSLTGAKLLSSPPTPPPHLFLFSRIPRPRHSPLPYNRLINQYNIFTERDSSERYCRCRETLSKARPSEGRRRSQRHRSFPFSSLSPVPLIRERREKRSGARSPQVNRLSTGGQSRRAKHR